MQEKPTAALEQELSACADLRAYLKTNTGALCAPGLPALLQQLMQSKGLSRAELLRRSGLNAVYGYQILAGKRHPGRDESALPVLRPGSRRGTDAEAPPARRLCPMANRAIEFDQFVHTLLPLLFLRLCHLFSALYY